MKYNYILRNMPKTRQQINHDYYIAHRDVIKEQNRQNYRARQQAKFRQFMSNFVEISEGIFVKK